jgi:toxin ParE1/3/4
VNPVRFHPEAEAELIAAVAYYEGQRAGLGVALRQEVEAVVRLIQQNPQLFAAQGPVGLRKCPVRRFPYAIYYQELNAEIWIAAVAHRRQRPGYWAGRSPV